MKKIPYLIIGLSLAMLTVAGCRLDQPVTPDEIARQIREIQIEADDLHASLELTLNTDVLQDRLLIEMWEKKTDKLRVEILEANNADWRGMTLVINGQQAWLYNPQRQQVTVGNRDQVKLPMIQDVIYAMQDLLRTTEADRLQLLGIVKVNDSEAYKLAYAIPDDGQATVWIDREQWLPLRVEYEDPVLGQGTIIFHSYETNQGLAEGLFQFQPPPGVNVISIEGPAGPQAITLDQAKSAAPFPLLVPSYIPPETNLTQIFEVGRSFAFYYEGQHPFTLVQGQSEATAHLPTSGSVQYITLRGTQATFVANAGQGGTFLGWEENGVHISIAGALSQEEAIKIAESLEGGPGDGGNWSISPASS